MSDFLRRLEEELNSPEMLDAIEQERLEMLPENVLRKTHGSGWMDEEQRDWEEGRDETHE